jgi:hypothetical protein
MNITRVATPRIHRGLAQYIRHRYRRYRPGDPHHTFSPAPPYISYIGREILTLIRGATPP